MTAAATTPGMIDISQASKVPFSRLVRVELRKMADTRAGFWLLSVLHVRPARSLITSWLNDRGRSSVGIGSPGSRT